MPIINDYILKDALIVDRWRDKIMGHSPMMLPGYDINAQGTSATNQRMSEEHKKVHIQAEDWNGKTTPLAMIAMRLRIRNGDPWPVDHMTAHVTDNEAFVFIVNKGKPTVIEDDPALFPSDALITQLRLIIG